MKKIELPIVDDCDLLCDLANNKKLVNSSYPHIKNNIDIILEQYFQYMEKKGNALDINSAAISKDLSSGLKSNYSNTPKGLEFIELLRCSSPDICPMCGSFHSSTIDHLLPKEDYPEWAIFSKNLVPACQFNSKRGRILKGDLIKKERILHPYYDEVLSHRNISCRITSVDNYRLVNIDIICVAKNGPNLSAIIYHIENVVKRAGIVRWLEKQWTKIRHKPSNIILTLKEDFLLNDVIELKKCLDDLLKRLDDRSGSANNWESVFIHGILNSENAIQWIFAHHNKIVKGLISTEVG